MKELILQNYNHPSVVVWGLSNEITVGGDAGEDLLENHRLLNDLCHQLDPTRRTVVAAVSMCPIESPYLQIPDTVSYNHYFGWYGGDTSMNGPWFDHFHEVYPNIPIGCSEYGCEALDYHTSDPQQGNYTEEYQAHYHEELIRQLFSRKYLWATHVRNMFDFGADGRNEGGENGQNHKGLVTFDRKYKKDAIYAYKAWLSDEPFVHICGKRYIRRVEDVTQPEGRFSLNDKIRDLLADEAAARYVRDFLDSAMRSLQQDGQQESFMNMVEGLTLLRLSDLLVQMQPEGKKLTKQQLLELNDTLNGIAKP